MRTIIRTLLLVPILALPIRAQAQEAEPELQLSIKRNIGYGGGTRIQGSFTLSVTNPGELTQVEFQMDGQAIHVDRQPPFSFRFSTGDFELGMHTLTAVGTQFGGQTLQSNSIQREFVSADAAWQTVKDIMVPLLVGIGVLTALGVLVPALLGRRPAHQPGEYGAAGGAVCPRCQNPYARHFLSPNLMFGKLERCPHCGKWAIVRRATPAELTAAEARLAAESLDGYLKTDSERDRLERMLEDSRFDD